MTRIEPPPLAAWILEHCIPGRRDEALAGDLLEALQEGRSNGWYWRQASAACLVGWSRYLGDRVTLIAFAALWSMLAPAWAALVDRVENRDVAWPVSVAAWVGLNLGFIWTGMLLYAALRLFSVLRAGILNRAFGTAAAVFLPVYFATYILMNLFAWPGLAVDWRTLSPLGEIIDLRVWADVLRFPYFVTMLWSMWKVAPSLASARGPVIEWSSQALRAPLDGSVRPVTRDPYTVKRMLLTMAGAGLLNALIAGFVICRLPEAHHPGPASLFVRAMLYACIDALAGAMGTYIYWKSPSNSFRSHAPISFSLFALMCAAGWIWVPALVLFSEQATALTAWVAMAGAFLLASEIRRLMILIAPQPQMPDSRGTIAARPLFVESLYHAPLEPHGYLIALLIYATGWAIAARFHMTAATFLATAAFLFAWRTTAPRNRSLDEEQEYRRARRRLAGLALPAVLVTMWALLDGVAYRNHLAEVRASGEAYARESSNKSPAKSATHPGNGYESLILWPYPPKKEIVAPVQESSLLAPGTKQPIVIRFDGQYWYMQPPDERPGPLTHQAHGSPLDFHIASTNSFPLMMEAHEFLRTPIRVARCREIRVEIANRENQAGSIMMAVWLKNTSNAGAPAVYLGQQPIFAPGSLGSSIKGASALQTLTFDVPASGKIRNFDEIAMMILPDEEHTRVGPRIAIVQFEFLPR